MKYAIIMKRLILVIIIVILLFIVRYLLKLRKPENEKKSIFECGFDPHHENRNAFSLRFFLITIIFLLFDLEVTFVLALPLQIKIRSISTLIYTHTIIFLIFIWGTYIEWKQGALNWFWSDI